MCPMRRSTSTSRSSAARAARALTRPTGIGRGRGSGMRLGKGCGGRRWGSGRSMQTTAQTVSWACKRLGAQQRRSLQLYEWQDNARRVWLRARARDFAWSNDCPVLDRHRVESRFECIPTASHKVQYHSVHTVLLLSQSSRSSVALAASCSRRPPSCKMHPTQETTTAPVLR